ncbi:probable helicase MAGATAMA 3 isoform X2 [Magnolia sinica]|uniref:probable helicase MAGATAMA 3 isoform X2 n=1 Tax=Magnolia sinica TaxID=86752 RepID=UPI002658A1E3|nr:probable helicase MAGATAMA 3 isoform X2 [Magnolia sinica]
MAIQGVGKGAAAPSASQLARFQRIVLSWDYLRLLKEHSQKKGAAASSGLKRVKATYKDVADYMNVFEPLLFEEVKAHIVQGRDNEENPECYKGVVVSCVEDANGFHMVSMGVKSEVTEEISENDLLLLSNEKFQEATLPSTYAFALVEYRDGREKLKLRTFLAGEVRKIITDETESSPRLLKMLSVFKATNSFLWILKGPPGTGKTQTILGLLSAILHAAPARVQSKGALSTIRCKPELPVQEKYCHWTKASPWLTASNPRDLIMPTDGDDGFFPTTGNELKPEVVTSNRKYRVHVLVCAPSNSALDEIVLRLINTGIRDENDHVYNPKIVRIGLKPHHSVQAVSMDYLVDQKLASVDRSMAGTAKHGDTAALDRDRIRSSILDEAAIVFSTLSFSGSTLFTRMNRVFDVVIIDEAAQAVEPATLVPLAHGCKQVFLVGDPVQLPATVISSTAEKMGYGMSLFKRFQKAGYPVQMLKTQYRMHPQIRSFPSREFYSDSLDDGPDLDRSTKRPWHEYRCFGPFCFFDIDGVESQPSGSGSWVNVDEVDFVLLMYHQLVTKYSELKSTSRLAVISPYRHQVKLFRERFRDAFGVQSDQLVDINTVDGFQGREKDVAIFSCVRSNDGKGIGFVADFRRMNVGITRARSSILVVGSASTLMQDEHWSNLVKAAKDQNCLIKVSKPYASFFSQGNLKSMLVVKEETKVQLIEKHLELLEANTVNDGDPVGEGDHEGNADDDNMDVDDMGFDED